jgi:hypothetical protein
MSSESRIMTIAAPLDGTLSNPDSHIRTDAVGRRKLLTAMSAVALSGAASNLFARATLAEAAEPAPAVAPSVCVFDVNETLLDIEFLSPLFQRLFGDPKVVREWFGPAEREIMAEFSRRDLLSTAVVAGASMTASAADAGEQILEPGTRRRRLQSGSARRGPGGSEPRPHQSAGHRFGNPAQLAFCRPRTLNSGNRAAARGVRLACASFAFRKRWPAGHQQAAGFEAAAQLLCYKRNPFSGN